ncbi:MAG: bifunctional DNA-formamidopyrimidine glycosylase/DNA-(apurinic or apyrimidinic site) lyase [Candidatus Buchananbacteria bacterium]|nr:bifunctional DNA-formamidopyrimidine glycosylase/DNA-(apurinic or apyrimidinic site) lyase [Candidatus Buchananbacteria bacterium]
MPELPEVETLRRELQKAVKGKIIKSAQVKWPKMVRPLSVKSFSRQISNNKVMDVDRRAKVLLLKLSKCDLKTKDCFLAVHLKMTGQLILRPKKGKLVVGGHPQKDGTSDLPGKHTHVIIKFTDGSILYFNDIRKFGWMKVLNNKAVAELSVGFGVEALSPKFDFKKLKEVIKRYPNRKIKQILTDQKLIAGIGNIYADESCFCAAIMPNRSAKDISDKEITKLLSCVKKILKLAIAKGGTSSDTYVQLSGQPGGFVPYLKVYGRKGERCKRCQGKIERIRVGGRGTHFCPSCQK